VALIAVVLTLCAPSAHADSPAAAKDFSKPAIVILGYGLNDNGTMRDILRLRVLTGLAVAQFFLQSPVIVTGGNLRNGRTEAARCAICLCCLAFRTNASSSRTRRTARSRTRGSRCRWPSRPGRPASSW
jgi:hypothetical protein